ncbi:MAG: ATP-binding protein [Ginsengibacter sp.]
MRNTIIKYLLLCIMQIVGIHTMAQQPYSLVHYDEKLLPQTTVGNIVQDENGYLWMNTQFGIVRFDGEKVRVFTTDNLKGLTSNRIRVCSKGYDNSIYFVDENNVIIKVKSPNEFEITATADDINNSKLPLYSPECNSDFGIMHFDKKAGFKKLSDSLKLDLKKEILKSYFTGEKKGYFFYEDINDDIRLCYYDGENYTTKIQANNFKSQHTFKLNNLIFHQTSPTVAIQFEKATQENKIQVNGLPENFARRFKEEMPVLFSNSSGAFFYDSGRLYQYKLIGNVIDANLLFENLPCTGVVNVMQEKNTGDYLLSTKSAGFYRVKKKRFEAINLNNINWQALGKNTSANQDIAYALNLWDKQHIFYNGYITPVKGKGLSRLYQKTIKPHFNYFFHYPKDSLHIWLSFNDSIQSFNKKTGEYTPLLKILDPKSAVELSNGTTIIVAAKQIVSLKNNLSTKLYQNDSIYITTAEKVTEDCLAIGTEDGFYYYYISTKKLQPVPYDKHLKIRFIFKDKSARVWFTTYGQGLYYASGNTIIPIPADNAGYLAIGHSIVEDNSGHFWVPTNHGLFKLGYSSLLSIIDGRSNKLYYTYFDKTDGFNTNEFNGGCFPAYAYDRESGVLYFPSMSGIIQFHPDSILSMVSKSSIIFDEILINDTGHVYALSTKLVFPSQTSSLKIYFSSPYYGHNENIKFSYSISNKPGQWKYLENDRSIALNNLPGGNYTITVRKEEASGNPVTNTINFTIQKDFFETTFFLFLLLALAFGLTYLTFRARLLFLANERKRLEKEVAFRTANQKLLMDHKEKIIEVLIHDIKSPLYFLNSVAASLDKNITINNAIRNKELTNGIATSLNSLFLLTQDFSIWLNSSQPGHLQNYENVNLVNIIEESLDIYSEVIDKKNISINKYFSPIIILGDEPMIKSVMRNLIDNAIKNTSHGGITIKCEYLIEKKNCIIEIADTGIGMAAERLKALNQFFESDQEILIFSTSGFGHKVVKDFLYKLGGTIFYRQNNPSGVIATVSIPLSHQSI